MGQFRDKTPFPDERCSTDSSPVNTGWAQSIPLINGDVLWVTAHLDLSVSEGCIGKLFPSKSGFHVVREPQGVVVGQRSTVLAAV